MASAAALLLGTVEIALPQGPMRLPDLFLAPLAGGAVLTVWLDGCLALWPRPAWEALATRILSLPMSVADARAFARLVFSSAVELHPPTRRLVVPPGHRRLADLDERAVLIGAGDHAEIWDPDRWDEMSRRRLDELTLPALV
jgi:MraZ protein